MPRGDGTGPAGMGPMTGRAAGYCAGYSAPGFMNPMLGFGRGRGGGGGGWGRGGGGGGGGGRGWRNQFYATGQPGWARAGYGVAPYPGLPFGGSYMGAPSKEQEIEALKGQAQGLEEALASIRERVAELESEKPKK